MPLQIDDGYTLKGETTGKGDTGEVFPVVSFEYRPPLASEMQAYRFRIQTAPTWEVVYAARCEFLIARLVSWDVIGKDKKPFPIATESFAAIPDPIFQDLLIECAKWKGRATSQGEAAGNSQRA